MKITASFVFGALLASVAASDLQARAVTCADLTNYITGNGDVSQIEVRGQQVTDYCRTFMGITARTVTSTVTSVRATRTLTQASMTTTVLSITPDLSTRVVTQKTTSLTTTTPVAKDVTRTITSTAYMDNDGNTIAVAKRDAMPTHLYERAVPVATPTFFRNLSNNDKKTACRCMTIPRSTVTRRVTKGVYATATKVIPRKVIKTTTIPTPVTTSTLTNVLTRIATAPVPSNVIDFVEFDQVKGCPPNTATTFLCPSGVSEDDGSDPNFNTCGVEARDGYEGSCVYWLDDGSPVESTLTKGDGSGDPANDFTRPATYGDSDDDDCPTWSDYTCAPMGQKRSLIENMAFEKRAVSKTKARKVNRGGSRKNHGRKKAIPNPPPVRGASYIPYSEYLASLNHA